MIKKRVMVTCCVGLLASQVAIAQGGGSPAQDFGYGYGQAPYGQPPGMAGTGGYPYPGQAPPPSGPASGGGKSNPMKQMTAPMGKMMEPMQEMMGGSSGQGQSPPGYGASPAYVYPPPPAQGGYGYSRAPQSQTQPPAEDPRAPQ